MSVTDSKEVQITFRDTISFVGELEIDRFLLTALSNQRDRITILKLEQVLEKFIKDGRRNRLEFPAMSSYQRLILHRVAQYFRLEHSVVELDALKRTIILNKTSESRIPVLRFFDLVEQETIEIQTKPVKIMKREDKKHSKLTEDLPREKPQLLPDKVKINGKDRTLEEREEEYAKARARIFGIESNAVEESISFIPNPQMNAVVNPTPISPRDQSRKLDEDQNDKVKQTKKLNLDDDPIDYYRRIPDSAFVNKATTLNREQLYSSHDPVYNRNQYTPVGVNLYSQNVTWFQPTYSLNSVQSSITPEPTLNPYSFNGYSTRQKFPHRLGERHGSFDLDLRSSQTILPVASLSAPVLPHYYDSFSGYNSTDDNSCQTYPSPYVGNVSFVNNPIEPTHQQSYPYERRIQTTFDPNPTKHSLPISNPLSVPSKEMKSSYTGESQPHFPRSPSHDSFFSGNQVVLQTLSSDSITVSQMDSMKSVPSKLEHILEISLPIKESQLNEIKETGAIIKKLENDVLLAIYKTSTAANLALGKINTDTLILRHWTLPLGAVPSTTLSSTVNDQKESFP